MIDRLVVFGGTGDLMGRYLLPGLAALQARGQLPEGFELIGAARDDWDDEHYRDWAAGWLESQPGGEGAALLRAEEGVTPEHGTETFAEVLLELDSWRWSGTRFRLRTGKALGRDRKEILVRFRPAPHHPFDRPPVPNTLRFGLDPGGPKPRADRHRPRRVAEPRAADAGGMADPHAGPGGVVARPRGAGGVRRRIRRAALMTDA